MVICGSPSAFCRSDEQALGVNSEAIHLGHMLAANAASRRPLALDLAWGCFLTLSRLQMVTLDEGFELWVRVV